MLVVRSSLGSIAAWRLRSRVRVLYACLSILSPGFNLFFVLLLLFYIFLFFLFLRPLSSCLFLNFSLFSLHSRFSLPVFFSWLRRCRFQHGPCAGLVLHRSAWSCGLRRSVWSCGALLSPCQCRCGCVISCVLVTRVVRLGSWGGPYCLGSLQWSCSLPWRLQRPRPSCSTANRPLLA